MRCENCGIPMTANICPNCDEELFIVQFQNEYIDNPVSDDFSNKILEQKKEWKKDGNLSDYQR